GLSLDEGRANSTARGRLLSTPICPVSRHPEPSALSRPPPRPTLPPIMPRVVHLYKDYDPPVVGGVERMMRWTAERTARRDGWESAALVAQPADPERRGAGLPERETINGVEVVRLPALGRPGGTPLVPGMAKRLLALAPDLVHLHHPCPTAD